MNTSKFKTFDRRNQVKQSPVNPKLAQTFAAARRRSRESTPAIDYLKRADRSELAGKVLQIMQGK